MTLPFTKADNNFAIGYRSGNVLTYQLPDVFAHVHPDEGLRLDFLLEDMLYGWISFVILFYSFLAN